MKRVEIGGVILSVDNAYCSGGYTNGNIQVSKSFLKESVIFAQTEFFLAPVMHSCA